MPLKLAKLYFNMTEGAATAAQTVTATVCCQTLRGEEGEKEKGYSHGDFGKSKTLHLSPLLRFILPANFPIPPTVFLHVWRQGHCPTLQHASTEPCISFCRKMSMKQLHNYFKWNNYLFSLTLQGRQKKRCTGASAPHTLPFRQPAKEPQLKEAFNYSNKKQTKNPVEPKASSLKGRFISLSGYMVGVLIHKALISCKFKTIIPLWLISQFHETAILQILPTIYYNNC